MWDLSSLCVGHTGVGTDHDKLLAQLETELKASQQLVKLQQQMLQVWVFTKYILSHRDLLLVLDLFSMASVCRIVSCHLSPLSWLIPII